MALDLHYWSLNDSALNAYENLAADAITFFKEHYTNRTTRPDGTQEYVFWPVQGEH